MYFLRLALSLCAVLSGATHAQVELNNDFSQEKLWVVIPLASRHLNPPATPELNQKNLGLGVEYRYSGNTALAAGFFKNSNFKSSGYAGAWYTPFELPRLGPLQPRVGVLGGLASGYGNVLPVVLPALRLEGQKVSINLVYIPPVDKRVISAIALQVAFKF